MTNKWPHYSEQEIQKVTEILKSGKVNYWTGDEGISFEKEFANYIGCKHAIAVTNGSIALDIALYALNINEEDEVIVTPRTFVASAMCISLAKATPVFVDVELNSQNITAKTIRPAITNKTKAIICVHHAGFACDMNSITQLAEQYNLSVIEDCAQAHGGSYNGIKLGNFGDIATFSFCQDKIISTVGEGGMITTNNKQLWKKMWEYKDHGKSHDAVFKQNHPDGYRWVHQNIGSNYRLNELSSAIGRMQLNMLDKWINTRNFYASILSETFRNIPALRITEVPENIIHAYYKYYIFIREEMLKPGWSRNLIINKINEEGIFCQAGTCGNISKEQAFVKLKLDKNMPNSELLANTALMFQIHPTLCIEDIELAAKVTKQVMIEATI